MRTGALAVFAALVFLPPTAGAQPAEKPDPSAPRPAAAAPARQTPRPAARQTAAARPTMTVLVTDREGQPLEGVKVAAAGPVDRDAVSAADGTVTLRNMSAGAYRLRFEGDGLVTFEKEVTVATRAVKTTAAISAAPAPPPAPEPPAAETPAPPPPPPSGPPTSISIPDFFEKNRIGNVPSKTNDVGCTGTSTARLIQLRDPLTEHTHGDGDEMLYVVAGDGTEIMGGKTVNLSPGVLTVLPRGTPHALSRRGSRPLIVLSFVTGPACQPQQ